MADSRVALVFGATGVSGWALVREIAAGSGADKFTRVIGVCNEPTEGLNLFLDTPTCEIVSGVDLLGGLELVVAKLKVVKGIHDVTHCFYVAARDAPNFEPVEQKRISTTMIETAVLAVEQLSSRFQVLTMQTSINVYGIFASLQGASLVCPSPLVESAGRTVSPFREMDAHYAQCDTVSKLNEGKKWKYFEVRPDAVVGYIPRSHKHNFTLSLGLYFSLYRHLHGRGAEVKFPGTSKSYDCHFGLVSQDTLARFHIYLATHGDDVKSGDAFNIANGDVLTWSRLWPALAATMGLVGVGPDAESGFDWPFEDASAISAWEDKYELQPGWGAKLSEMCFVNTMLPAVDRVMSLDKARALGFTETRNTEEAFAQAWGLLRDAKVMPPAEQE